MSYQVTSQSYFRKVELRMSKGDAPRAENGLRQDFLLEDWLVQPQLNRVTRGHQTVQVQPKIMAVLVCLAEEPGAVVIREKLFKMVWSETYVTEHVLARSISVLRKIFNDTPKNPRVIETIPKVGYRLIAPISNATEESAGSTAEEAGKTAPQKEDGVPSRGIHVSQTKADSHWISHRTLSWAVGVLGLLFVIFFAMGAAHRHLH